ncbi:MAG: hypothetical protein QOF33_3773 [Thermomicrobiales bacterium]|jgi:hypothetical protein|nr:hypothetical protein [Thermomicrobiales bacterium]MEA2585688.1 hypothetical protein [Thermomicrobiales bacterium]
MAQVPPVPEDVEPGVEALAETLEDETEDRLFGLVAFGLMILLLICVVLVLIADRRPPAGL